MATVQIKDLLRLARQALEARNLDSAESIVRRILEQDPLDAEAKVMLSSIERLRKRGVKGNEAAIQEKADGAKEVNTGDKPAGAEKSLEIKAK